MKNILTTLLLIITGINVSAEMRYNPLNNLIYSHPEMSTINQDEYRMLISRCIEIENCIVNINKGIKISSREVLDQCCFYLKLVGTATAFRLMKDLKKNKVYYANGRFMKKIF